MYRGTLIYAEPFLAWRHTNLVCGYDLSIRQVCAASAYQNCHIFSIIFNKGFLAPIIERSAYKC